MKEHIQIAIDGPASAGKSTVAKLVAKKLNYVYCDTGAMYRAITFEAMAKNISLDDDNELVNLLKKTTISFKPAVPEQLVFINDQDITQAIRQPEVTNNVSTVAAQEGVRQELVKRQQEIADAGSIVMDGRDIGTTVLPNAEIKIFLVASVKERALRRFKENQIKGIDTALDILELEIAERDRKDSTREISPLVQAKDAILVDTTSMNIEGVVQKIMEIINK
ncbi:cytidylate kinase [Dellaglioa algida]|uniref:Cytidylate kinase n=2 Tax=Dellaglioa algida TaxID=105612 RepID=A0A0R1HIY5_9LACO|nr:(d)CMP kinase [Dellaglioa algida]KRK46621.1 cytidylate kinase [Dellaglioa algida DSM 15638]MDK1726331.1 (d)CMP kinase [Dellaglioa algida]MDK1727578.1 (d)CMP kinase [Dellaglioa algida]MDK1732461.1 (d)CMP kinase [Dellaglioa algida]MDK1734150.1 (d)CMP kinase [Dellaglioa algida]